MLGFVAVFLVMNATLAAGRLQAAGEELTEVAQAAATWAARYDDRAGAERLVAARLPDASVEVTDRRGEIRVMVTRSVPLIGPEGSPVRRTLVGRAEVRTSPYRAGRG